jgi:L-asparaginase II
MSEPEKKLDPGYLPLYQTIRGEAVESIHYGAIAVVDSAGSLYAWYGNPQTATYLRSSAKPFQTIPLVEMNGMDEFKISPGELAITCASHSGTDCHVKTVYQLQEKIGVEENDLLCGIHQPLDKATRMLLRDRGEQPSPNRHNCSGKHTGMLGQAMIMGADLKEYSEVDHPVQAQILTVISEMCKIPTDQIMIGRDGCSVPTYFIPLYHTAWGWARLVGGEDIPHARRSACQQISDAMTAEPFMVAGPGRLDTKMMNVFSGIILSKSGAEAYQAAAIMEDALFPGSPGLGLALKISDGDMRKQARRAVFIETLKQLGFFSPDQLEGFSKYGPKNIIRNQRGLLVGSGTPCFQLQYS